MLDTKLRDLERKAKASGSYYDRFPYRNALILAGRAADAGVEIGDIVEIEEAAGNNWVSQNADGTGIGKWLGEVTRLYATGEFRAYPRSEVKWRVVPTAGYLKQGHLLLSKFDKRIVVKPVEPDRYEALAPVRKLCSEESAFYFAVSS